MERRGSRELKTKKRMGLRILIFFNNYGVRFPHKGPRLSKIEDLGPIPG